MPANTSSIVAANTHLLVMHTHVLAAAVMRGAVCALVSVGGCDLPKRPRLRLVKTVTLIRRKEMIVNCRYVTRVTNPLIVLTALGD